MSIKASETTYEIKYTGYLSDSEDVVLHYGYDNWEDISEKKMRKLKTCCKAEVTLAPDAELNFCFRDNDGRWDNNLENNYYFKQGETNDYNNVEVSAKLVKVATKPATVKAKVATAKAKASTATKTKTTTRSKASSERTKK